MEDFGNAPATGARHDDGFGSPAALLDVIREAGLAEAFGFSEDTLFLVESAFLRSWNRELEDGPNQNGLDECEAYPVPAKNASERGIHVWMEYHGAGEDEAIYLMMETDEQHPGKYALMILRNDNVIYWRTIEQDPATEWQINCMAGDPTVTGRDGEMLFRGETHNV